MYERYGDKVQFYMVYIREAHPAGDGRPSRGNQGQGIAIEQPETLLERAEVCQQMCEALHINLPPLIDTMNNAANLAYSAHPDRLYLTGVDGKIVYMSERGPWGFKPDELEAAINNLP